MAMPVTTLRKPYSMKEQQLQKNEKDIALLLAEEHLGNQTAFCHAVDRNVLAPRNTATSRSSDCHNETTNSDFTTTN